MPSRPAIAVRWMIALVEPPIASSTRSAFSTDFAVMIRLGRRSVPISSTARRPLASAARRRSACTAGIAAVPGSVMPSASAIEAMVLAVPITAQVPAVVARLPSTSSISSSETFAGAVFRPEAPAVGAGAEPLAVDAIGSIGPPTSWIAGRSADAAPINCAGTVLSQPPTSTTASIGWARIISSTSIAIRLRNIMLVGREEDFAERDGREVDRQRAGGEHAALDRIDQLGEMAVAVVEAARRPGRCRRPARQHVGRVAHRLRERAPQVEREVGVAIIGEAAGDAVLFSAHENS